MSKLIDLTGMPFGRLIVIGPGTRGKHQLNWICRCECGTEFETGGPNLRYGDTQSCGCLKVQIMSARFTTHGATKGGQKIPEYQAWNALKGRCTNKNNHKYPDYGGRGITVCDRWLFGENGATAFECFLKDMGYRPTPIHSVGRANNNGNYDPTNCSWETPPIQDRNKRNNVIIIYKGATMILADALRASGFTAMQYHNIHLTRDLSPQAAFDLMLMRPDLRVKLTDDDVIAVRIAVADGVDKNTLAKKYGVGRNHIYLVATGRKRGEVRSERLK